MLPSYYSFYFTFCFVQVVELFANSSWLPAEIENARKYLPRGGSACFSDDGTNTL
jgi:hypothetical protein